MSKLKVINLFGAPGHGKSSVRSGLFWLMKSRHMSVEEVSEYAKYLVLTGRTWQLKEEQLYLFSKQHHKQLIIERSGYEYAATDSPLQLCAFYAPPGYYQGFSDLVDEAHERFENINFFLSRDLDAQGAGFEDRGRVHDRDASMRVEAEMREYLARKSVPCVDVPVDMTTPWRILAHLTGAPAEVPDFETAGLQGLVFALPACPGEPAARLERTGSGARSWAVRSEGDCLGKDGEWHAELLPSNRTEPFLELTRFATPGEARAAWARYTSRGRSSTAEQFVAGAAGMLC